MWIIIVLVNLKYNFENVFVFVYDKNNTVIVYYFSADLGGWIACATWKQVW